MPPTNANGKICYIEIPAADIAASAAFYSAVFGWTTRTRGDGAIAFDDTTGQVSGVWTRRLLPATSPGFLIYIMVADAPATIASALNHGARLIQPIGGDAPEITARIADPAGNVIGIYQERALTATA
jgi:predicted enzyme related to lactoylglutathione lyase